MRYAVPAWLPHVTAERFINLFSHGGFFIGDLDEAWRPKFFASLRDQALMLGRSLSESPDGLPRLKCAAALTLAGLCLADERIAANGLKRLLGEIQRQLLPDGDHVSRSPAQLLDSVRLLTMVKQALAGTGRETDPFLDQTLDRMLLLLRFFRLGDGALAVFGGGGEDDARIISALLAQDQRQDQRLTHLPEFGLLPPRLGPGSRPVRCRHVAARRVLDHRPCRLPELRNELRRASPGRQLRFVRRSRSQLAKGIEIEPRPLDADAP